MNTDIIRAHLDRGELLAQLAEEATELAKAALKLRRVYSGINPTPITEQEALENLLEEMADISTCIHVLGYDAEECLDKVHRTTVFKLKRWADRLEGGTGNG